MNFPSREYDFDASSWDIAISILQDSIDEEVYCILYQF